MSEPDDVLLDYARAKVERDRRDKIRASNNPDDPRRLLFESSRKIEPHQVDWLWPGRLACGKVTLIAGDPGIGKSQVTIDLAARVSTGAYWPDEGCAPSGSVLVLSA